MRISELLKLAPGAKRSQIYFFLRRGYLKSKRIRRGAKTNYEFFEEGPCKVRLMLNHLSTGNSPERASRLADQQLAAARQQLSGAPIRLAFLDNAGKPLKNAVFKLEALNLYMETGPDGTVETLRGPPDLLVRNPYFTQGENAFRDVLDFLESVRSSNVINSDQIEAIERLVDLYEDLASKDDKVRQQVFDASLQLLVGRLDEVLHGTQHADLIPKELVALYENFPTLQEKEIHLGQRRIEARNLPTDVTLSPLFFGGYYGLRKEGITLGDLKAPHSTIDPRGNITIPVANLSNLIAGPPFFQLFARQVAKQYNLTAPLDLLTPHTSLTPADVREGLRLIRMAVAHLRNRFNEMFTNLLDSLTFYSVCASFYTASSVGVHIFSRTSGLVIPDEHFGDENLHKNPYRQLYFGAGLLAPDATNVQRFYQWNEITTARTLYENYKRNRRQGHGELYRQRCIELLATQLVIPNLELSEADFAGSTWKNYFTLVSQDSVVLSSRSEDMRQLISHGLVLNRRAAAQARLVSLVARIVQPGFEGNVTGLHTYDIVHTSYARDSKRILKPLNAVSKDPGKDAEDIVDELLTRGSKLAAQKKEEKSP